MTAGSALLGAGIALVGFTAGVSAKSSNYFAEVPSHSTRTGLITAVPTAIVREDLPVPLPTTTTSRPLVPACPPSLPALPHCDPAPTTTTTVSRSTATTPRNIATGRDLSAAPAPTTSTTRLPAYAPRTQATTNGTYPPTVGYCEMWWKDAGGMHHERVHWRGTGGPAGCEADSPAMKRHPDGTWVGATCCGAEPDGWTEP